jgi:PhnB protein
MSAVKAVPEGYHSATPYMTVRDAAAALDFYTKAFGAEELFRLTEPGGRIGHAEFRIGDSPIMISDEYPDFGALSPAALGGSPIKMMLYVPDCDAAVKRAVAAGATVLRQPADQFYGDRTAMVADPFGHGWYLQTRIEEVSPQEMQKRYSKAMGA